MSPSGGPRGTARVAGLSIAEYAQSIAERERILDDTGVCKQGAVFSGDVRGAWERLRAQAARFGLQIVEGDLDATNRVREWDDLILNDARTEREWRREYPRAFVQGCGLDPDDDIGRAVASHFAANAALMWNAFVPLHARRSGIVAELVELAEHVRRAPPEPAKSAGTGGDPLIFPGQKLGRVSDFARISRAAQRGEFKAALSRADVDSDTFANLCARFNAKMQEDPALEALFKRMLSDPRLDE